MSNQGEKLNLRECLIDTRNHRASDCTEEGSFRHDSLLAFRDVAVRVPAPATDSAPSNDTKKPMKTILDKCCGFVQAGELLSILGPSGSGKTTLLSCLGNRLDPDEGDMRLVDLDTGESLTWQNVGFVAQDDRLFPHLTVKETLETAARLRLGTRDPAYIDPIVNDLIEDLRLTKVRDSRVGGPKRRGISGGERKRVSIAMQLVHHPRCIFLDEPTTGLDSSSAYNVVRILRRLATKRNSIIVCTIHQPRPNIFAMFDRVLLLSEGQTAYFGPQSNIIEYFDSIGLTIPARFNPADFLLDIVSTRALSEGAVEDSLDSPESKKNSATQSVSSILYYARLDRSGIIASYAKSSLRKEAHSELEAFLQTRAEGEVLSTKRKGSNYSSTIWFELRILTERAFKCDAREPMASYVRLIQTLFIAFLIGALYFNVRSRSVAEIQQDIPGAIFFILTNQIFSALASLAIFVDEQVMVAEEQRSKFYRVGTYYVAKSFAQLPQCVIFPLIFSIITYSMVGFNSFSEFGIFGTYTVALMLILFTSTSFAVMITASFPILEVAQIVCPLVLTLLMLFGGFYSRDIPVYFAWLRYASMFRYGYAALLKLLLPHAYPGGEEQLIQQNLGSESLWMDLLCLLAMAVVFRVIGYLGMRRVLRAR